MREIKFRGRRKDKWYYGYYSTEVIGGYMHPEHGDIEGEVCHFIQDEGMDNHEVIPETVGQFTGVRDRKRTPEFPKGQEIYEGDNIVCRKYIGGNFVEYSIEKGIVSFKDGAFYLLREQGYYRPLSWLIEMDYELEVIGNAWDNPELVGDDPATDAPMTGAGDGKGVNR